MVTAVEKAIRESDLGLNPQTEGQTIRLRIPEMNEQRRKEMVRSPTSTPRRPASPCATCAGTVSTTSRSS